MLEQTQFVMVGMLKILDGKAVFTPNRTGLIAVKAYLPYGNLAATAAALLSIK
jgi:hypothetical protein